MGDWKYWKELPYRGEPPDNTPKNRRPKRRRTQKEIRRGNFIGVLAFVSIIGCIFGVLYIASDFQFDLFWKPALFFIGIFLIPFALNAGINAWNKYLQADDLNEPNNESK